MTSDCLDIFTRTQFPAAEVAWTALDSSARLECSIEANPAPAIVCSLRDLRYVMVNRRFLALTNSTDTDWLRRSMYERDILEGVVDHEQAKRALVDAQTIPQTRAQLSMPDGTSRCVTIAGQPVTVAGQSCMLFTLTDIDAWRRAERRHDQIRTSVETVFASSPACMMIVDASDHIVTVANDSLCSLTGYSRLDMAGRSADDIDIWPSGISSGFVHAKCGRLLECEVSQARVTIADRVYVLWTFQDVTNRRMDERSLAAAIDATLSESKWLSHAILDNLTLRSVPARDAVASGLSDLTARERDVLTLICEGMDDKTMARTLKVSGNTVRNHVARVYSKIGVNRRVAAAAWGRARGFDNGGTDRTTLLSSGSDTTSP